MGMVQEQAVLCSKARSWDILGLGVGVDVVTRSLFGRGRWDEFSGEDRSHLDDSRLDHASWLDMGSYEGFQ